MRALRRASGLLATMLAIGCAHGTSQAMAQRYVPRAFFDAFEQRQLVAETAELMGLSQEFLQTQQRWPSNFRDLQRFAVSTGRPLKLKVIKEVSITGDTEDELLLNIAYEPTWEAKRHRRVAAPTRLGLFLRPQ